MFTVTEGALERLSRKLDRNKSMDEAALRFTRRRRGWKLRLDKARPDDTAFTHEGRNVLLLDAVVTKAMAALTLDVNDTESGARLKLRRLTDEGK